MWRGLATPFPISALREGPGRQGRTLSEDWLCCVGGHQPHAFRALTGWARSGCRPPQALPAEGFGRPLGLVSVRARRLRASGWGRSVSELLPSAASDPGGAAVLRAPVCGAGLLCPLAGLSWSWRGAEDRALTLVPLPARCPAMGSWPGVRGGADKDTRLGPCGSGGVGTEQRWPTGRGGQKGQPPEGTGRRWAGALRAQVVPPPPTQPALQPARSVSSQQDEMPLIFHTQTVFLHVLHFHI